MGEESLGPLIVWLIFFGFWGRYVAEACGQSVARGVWHGILLGPFGLLLIAIYPRPGAPSESRDAESALLLTSIRDELRWQRQQKEKEQHRAKAAQSNKQ
jgi:hypothetical protein